MAKKSEPKSNELVRHYLAGQGDAAKAIFDRYVERLLALARTRIGPKLNRRIDPDDVVQSAYRSFFVHAHEYQLNHSGDLWRLLASTTLNKLYGQIEKQTAGKRSVHREAADEAALASLGNKEPTVAEVVAIGEQLRLILDGLAPDQRSVLEATLQGQSVEEIGQAIDKSPRTVRRLLANARRRFEQHLLEHDASQAPRKVQRRRSVEQQAPLRYSDYVLERLVGSGGMGKVYQATDQRSGQRVAIKALHKSRQADARAVAQFVQEAQVLARLGHPNIVGVAGLGRFPAGGFFLVMDFITGSDLQSRLVSGPLPVHEAVAIVLAVAAAVQHAHEHGVVHCDLKPGNILVDDRGHVFVTDFGFAYLLRQRAENAAIGGTAGYMAPEILRLASPPTPAADVFALGVLLWTLVTGKVPADSSSVRAEAHALRAMESICRRCLADNPAARYPSAAELSAALRAVQSL